MTMIVVTGLIVLYFLPSFVAFNRDHNNDQAIFMLNLLLGWTFLFWAVSFVWALTDNVNREDEETVQVVRRARTKTVARVPRSIPELTPAVIDSNFQAHLDRAAELLKANQ